MGDLPFNVTRHKSRAEGILEGGKVDIQPDLPAVVDAQKSISDQKIKEGPDFNSTASIEQIAQKFQTNVKTGLTSSAAANVLKRDGLNELAKPPKPSFLMLFLLQLTNLIIALLIAAACASLAVNGTDPDPDRRSNPMSYVEGIAIFLIVFVNAAIAAYTENSANNALDALSKMSQAQSLIVRDGKAQNVDSNAIVVGDICVLGVGDVVPADVRLFESADLKVNEMLLTGEPDDVAKTFKTKAKKPGEPEKLTPENCAFSSCSVTNGTGKGIVVTVGMQTRIGEIAGMLIEAPKKKCGCLPDTSGSMTPLQESLHSLGVKIGFLAIGVCVFVFLVGLLMETKDPDNPEKATWLYMILISVTLAVAAIPEGIPLCVTISLATGSSNMVKEMVLVRKLAAVETLGSASVICSDKTGTLTEGKMTMVKMWAGGKSYEVSGKGFDPTVGTITKSEADGGGDATKDPCVISTLFSALLCSSCTLQQEMNDEGVKVWSPQGNSSEKPIVVAAAKVNMWANEVYKAYNRPLEIPFSSSRKMMLSLVNLKGEKTLGAGGVPVPSSTSLLSCVKGAPNYILDVCSHWITHEQKVEPMTQAVKDQVFEVVDDLSGRALRVLAVAVHPWSSPPFDMNDEDIGMEDKFLALRKDLQLVGLVASIDPDRDGVRDSVLDARGASIRVVMITGDYLKTAVAIGHNVNILLDGDDDDVAACDCGSLRPNGDYLKDAEIDQLTAKTKVFARAKPEDKLEIVKSLQRQNLVCAMTGDGVNDAPALKRADIGVAMGIQGTEVAKGAADMILLDDNFCSIVTAVEKGRVIYSGIQKFVAFIMSVHLAEVLQIFICITSNLPVMRTPLQILFLILVTDLPPSIALGMEPGERGILKLRPRPKGQPIVLAWMWQSIVMNGMILSGVIIGVYMFALNEYVGEFLQDNMIANEDQKPFKDDLMKARTVAFISLVLSENVRAYTSRSFDKPVWVDLCTNKKMQLAIFCAQVALILAVFVPGFTDVLGLNGAGIGAKGWGMAAAGPIGTLIICEMYKLVVAIQVRNFNDNLRREQEAEEAARLADGKLDTVMKQVSGLANILEKKISQNNEDIQKTVQQLENVEKSLVEIKDDVEKSLEETKSKKVAL